jgi:hypothetical protein
MMAAVRERRALVHEKVVEYERAIAALHGRVDDEVKEVVEMVEAQGREAHAAIEEAASGTIKRLQAQEEALGCMEKRAGGCIEYAERVVRYGGNLEVCDCSEHVEGCMKAVLSGGEGKGEGEGERGCKRENEGVGGGGEGGRKSGGRAGCRWGAREGFEGVVVHEVGVGGSMGLQCVKAAVEGLLKVEVGEAMWGGWEDEEEGDEGKNEVSNEL